MTAESKRAWITVALAFLPVSLMMWPIGFIVFWAIGVSVVVAKPNLPSDSLHHQGNKPRNPK